MSAELLKPKVVELASGIFTRLVGDAARIADSKLTLAADPALLAQLSFKLAAAFQKVEDEINYEAMPKTGFKLSDSDLASWGNK